MKNKIAKLHTVLNHFSIKFSFETADNYIFTPQNLGEVTHILFLKKISAIIFSETLT